MADSRVSIGFNYYAWWFPGCPVRIHLALDVVRRLKEHLHAGQKAPGEGLLFGRASDGTTEVDDFRPVAGLVPDAVAAHTNEVSPGMLVGYYRVDPGPALRLNDSDLLLAQTCFQRPHHVILIVQTNGFGTPNASFFFHERNGSMGTVALMEFPFDAGLLAGEECERLKRSQDE